MEPKRPLARYECLIQCFTCHHCNHEDRFLREGYVASIGCKICCDRTFITLPAPGKYIDRWMDDGNGTVRVRHIKRIEE